MRYRLSIAINDSRSDVPVESFEQNVSGAAAIIVGTVIMFMCILSAAAGGCLFNRRRRKPPPESAFSLPSDCHLEPKLSIPIHNERTSPVEPDTPLAAFHIQPVFNNAAFRVPGNHVVGLDISGFLGSGACGSTYAVRWHGAKAALKIVDHDIGRHNARLLGDIPVLATPIQHRNVIQLYRVIAIQLPGMNGVALLPLELGPGERQARLEQEGAADLIDVPVEEQFGDEDDLYDIDDETFASCHGQSKGRVVLEWDLICHPSLPAPDRLPLADEPPEGGDASTAALTTSSNVPGPCRWFPRNKVGHPMPRGLAEIWIISERADRGPLEFQLDEGRLTRRLDGSVNWVATLRLLLDVAKGLQALHMHGIVHGDLKPGNVMLVSDSSDPRGYVAKLADAGLTPLLDLTRAKTSRRVHRRLRYLAPETQRDMRTDIATFAADIWSFSMVMYQCIAGRRPFAEVDLPTFYSNVITPGGTLRPDFLHVECLERCKYLMEKCWQENPAARPTAADLVADLQAQLGDVLSQDHLI